MLTSLCSIRRMVFAQRTNGFALTDDSHDRQFLQKGAECLNRCYLQFYLILLFFFVPWLWIVSCLCIILNIGAGSRLSLGFNLAWLTFSGRLFTGIAAVTVGLEQCSLAVWVAGVLTRKLSVQY